MSTSKYYQEHKDTWKNVYYQTQKKKLAEPEVRAKKNEGNKAHMRRVAGWRKQCYRKNKMLMFRQLGGICELCSFSDIRALQFDHIDPSKKTCNLTALLALKDLTKAFNELHNCRLLCANCHAIHTADSGRLSLGHSLDLGDTYGRHLQSG